MSANYKEIIQRLPKEEQRKYATGISLVSDFVYSLQKNGLLPKRFAKPVEPSTAQAGANETPQSRGLEPIGSAIEIPAVNEELYNRVREAVEQAGYNFIVPIRPVSIKDLIAEDRQREQDGGPRRLGFVNESARIRATVPPEMEVAIDPKRFKITGSNRLPTDEQQAKIKAEEARFKKQLPEDIRPFVTMLMVDPSTISQLEDAYMDKTGQLLLPDYFARTDVQGVQDIVAYVGRLDPTNQRHVSDWPRASGNGLVFAVSVVVLPRKLAV